MMNAVGIDVSKGKSMVSLLRPYGQAVGDSRQFRHTSDGVDKLIKQLLSFDGETRIVLEHTGRYHEPIAQRLFDAGFFVSAVNPKLIKDFGSGSLRKVKTDKADSVKIARYALDNWTDLKQYGTMDELREEIKTMNRQFGYYLKQRTALKNNLISLLDQAFPNANNFFDSPVRSDGHQKWVDFVHTYWHVNCIRQKSLSSFTEHYRK